MPGSLKCLTKENHSMGDTRVEYFFSYRSGDAKQVTKEQWEKEWLDWYIKKCANTDESSEEKGD